MTTEEADTLNIGRIMEVTGGDRFFARPMHENFEVTPRIMFVSNEVPTRPQPDPTICRRIKLYRFTPRGLARL